VTDDDTLELAKMIFAGKINTEILAALRNHGIEAVGLSGVDGNIVHAEKRPPKEFDDKTGEKKVDFGNVGDVLEINSRAFVCCSTPIICRSFPRSARTTTGRFSISTPTRSPPKSPSNSEPKN
jgi:hypothetical protein